MSVTNPSDCTAPAKMFTFDSVYGELERTELLYNEVCYSLVDNVLEGYNGTIFAYGQTGCGKTFTMQVCTLLTIFVNIEIIIIRMERYKFIQ